MNAIDLVPAAGERLAEVMAIMDDAFDPAFGEAWTAPQCAAMLVMPGVWLTLAVREGQAVGFSMARVVADEGELLLLGVRRAYRRAGVGAALLGDFCRAAARRGAARLHLEMRDGNLAAGIYRGAGFVPVGRRRGYYCGADGVTHDAVTLATAAQQAKL